MPDNIAAHIDSGSELGGAEKNLSIIFSFRNEEQVLAELIRRLKAALLLTELSYEIIFVNDASTDRSLDVLIQEAKQCPTLKIMTMQNRAGVMPCFIEGFRYSSGQAVVMMDSDLQDPPEIIPEMIKKWKQGAEVVYTIRKQRDGESPFKMAVTRGAYRILKHISNIEFPVDAGDFRLLTRKAVKAVLKENNPHVYLRGFVPSLRLQEAFVYYDREKRFSGNTHFPVYSLDPSGPAATFFTALLNFALPGRLFVFFQLFFFGVGVFTAAMFKVLLMWLGEIAPASGIEILFIFCWSTAQAAAMIPLRWYLCNREAQRAPKISKVQSFFGFDQPFENVSFHDEKPRYV